MKAELLPLSYGPDAICLRLDGGHRTYQMPWMDLGVVITDRTDVQAVTAHHLADGKIGVSVDEDAMVVYTPAEFAALMERHGNVMSEH